MSSIRRRSTWRHTLSEFDQITVLDRVDELVDEQFTGDINHLYVFLLGPNVLADGLHQVSLAKTDTAINEQRVCNVRAGACATARAAACAISLFGPTTKDSNVFRGLSPGTVAAGFVLAGGKVRVKSSPAAGHPRRAFARCFRRRAEFYRTRAAERRTQWQSATRAYNHFRSKTDRCCLEREE